MKQQAKIGDTWEFIANGCVCRVWLVDFSTVGSSRFEQWRWEISGGWKATDWTTSKRKAIEECLDSLLRFQRFKRFDFKPVFRKKESVRL